MLVVLFLPGGLLGLIDEKVKALRPENPEMQINQTANEDN